MPESETQPELPDAFTADRQVFEETPPEEALYALLGSKDVSGEIAFKDSAEWLIGRPKPIPTILIVSLIVAFSLAFWGFIIYLDLATRREAPIAAWVLMPIWWVVVIPGILAGCILVNRHIAKQDDYFRVNKAEGRLILPRVELELEAADILEIVELWRWRARNERRQSKLRLTSVLFRNSDGGVEQRPLGCEYQYRPWCKPAADRLAEILDKPIRRINLGLFESKGLGDD